MFTSAVIVAAGAGKRMGEDINKQFFELNGVPVVVRTLEIFAKSSFINEIILVLSNNDILYFKNHILAGGTFNKLSSVVTGGRTRQISVFNGLQRVSPGTDVVLVHDGARPFVKDDVLKNCIFGAMELGGACAGIPVKDTIKKTDGKLIKETLDRSCLWAIQTPQAFKYHILMDAHKKARAEGFSGTDDSVLVERTGIRPGIVMGGYDNIKITTKEDLDLAQIILEKK